MAWGVQSRAGMTRKLSSVLAGLLMITACTTPVVPIEPESTSPVTREGWLMAEQPEIFVIVADDADTPDAASLRANIAGALRNGLQHLRSERFGSCGSIDPAAWHPGDTRILLVRPSAPDAEALRSFIDDPDLAWITQDSTPEEIDTVAAAAASGLGARLAGPGETYRPLRAARRALDLITGTRAPEGGAEAQLVAGLPPEPLITVFLAGTRDDQDTAPVSTLVPSPAPGSENNPPWINIMAPAVTDDTWGCRVADLGNTRFGAWSEEVDAAFYGNTGRYAWPCESDLAWEQMFVLGWADCGPVCQDRALVTDGDAVRCAVFVDQTDLSRCPAENGRRDPAGGPTFVDHYGAMLRRCELSQLTGDALASCRESLSCEGCGNGFCLTEVPELTSLWQCDPGKYPWPLRFVGGVLAFDPGEHGWISINCETKASP